MFYVVVLHYQKFNINLILNLKTMKTVKITVIKGGKTCINTYDTKARAKQEYEYALTIFMPMYYTVELF